MPHILSDDDLDQLLRHAAEQVPVPSYPALRLPPRQDSAWPVMLLAAMGITLLAVCSAAFVARSGPFVVAAYLAAQAGTLISRTDGISVALMSTAVGLAVLLGLDFTIPQSRTVPARRPGRV